jgi:hypothetical protein
MAEEPRFLLGFGERLTETIEAQGGGADKPFPYTFDEAKARIGPMLDSTVEAMRALPGDACPDGRAVVAVTLHPQFIAKSYFPAGLLRAVGLDAIGSRPTRVTPAKWTRKSAPVETETTDLFLAGPRESFYNWAEVLAGWSPSVRGGEDLRKLERIRIPHRLDRVRNIQSDGEVAYLEAVLHVPADAGTDILLGFQEFLERRGAKADMERRLVAGGLCFIPVTAPLAATEGLAEFSFLRVVRSVPRLRAMVPSVRMAFPSLSFKVVLPEGTVDPDLRVAIFDGGLPEGHGMEEWVRHHEVDVGPPMPEGLSHGAQVTSSLLFGPLREGSPVDPPVCTVDHYRVLDHESANDPFELYDVLRRITKVLKSRRYDFVNLSIGPCVPIEDDEVHTWTSVLDNLLSDGDCLVLSAVGNDGEKDWESGNARVQVPADSVNGLAVGAADRTGDGWARAPYSSIGPGRSPGLVKPDLLAFGGSSTEPFWTIDPEQPPLAVATAGTSFATPAALRVALGVRAHLGPTVSPLVIRALMVHGSEPGAHRRECGWGRIPNDLEPLVVCPAGLVRVVYQGKLEPSEYMRAQIPVPHDALRGRVTITATIAYASQVDPQDPGNYTRSGLDVVFRPHAEKFDRGSVYPDTASFFQLQDYSDEQDLRRDAHKWETTLHRTRSKNASSLKDPVFDIHYNARLAGANSRVPGPIRYAMVISLHAPKSPDVYNLVLQRYRNLLVPLRPRIELPIRTRT